MRGSRTEKRSEAPQVLRGLLSVRQVERGDHFMRSRMRYGQLAIEIGQGHPNHTAAELTEVAKGAKCDRTDMVITPEYPYTRPKLPHRSRGTNEHEENTGRQLYTFLPSLA